MSPKFSRLFSASVAGLVLGVTWGMLETQERRAKARRVFDRIMATTPVGTGDE